MVARLSGADAASLHTQTSTTHSHTVALIVLEAADQLSHERLQQLMASSLPKLARFRSRLVAKPLGIGQPVWAEIHDYDPTSQIHRATLPAPGGPRELGDLIAHLSVAAGPQPLWHAWSINGLAGGRWALAVTMSPVLTDEDNGPALMWPHLLTSAPSGDSINGLSCEPSLGTPSIGELVTDAVSEVVENQVTGAWLIAEGVSAMLQDVGRRLRGAEKPDLLPRAASSMSGSVPNTVFNAPLTRKRSVALTSIPMADVEEVSKAFGGSVTNVLLAAGTLSLRAWFQRHDTVPDGPLLVQMPLTPGAAHPAAVGNSLTTVQIRLPVQLDDPIQILTNLHSATERLNVSCRCDAEKAYPTVDLATIASLIPPRALRAGMRLYAGLGLGRWRTPTTHGSVAYVAGKPTPAYCAGAKVAAMYTTAPLLGAGGLNITVTFRGDALDVCVCVCPDNVPAVDELATGIAESVNTLVTAAESSPRGQGRSVVTEMASHPAKYAHDLRY